MSKIITVICLMLLSSFITIGQGETTFWEKFTSFYNHKDYNEMYDSLTSDEFKSQISKSDNYEFFANNFENYCGELKSVEPLGQSKNQFLLSFQSCKVQCEIYFNKNYKIDGWLFLPYEENINNSLNTQLESKSFNTKEFNLKIEKELSEILTNRPHINISIGLINEEKKSYYHYNGVESNIPSNNSIYEIGSITKTYTALLLAKAVEDKKIRLEDDIRNYLPKNMTNLSFENHPIQIKHLVNHTSGLPRLPASLIQEIQFDAFNPYKNYDSKRLLEDLRSIQLSDLPGTNMVYSNLGYAVLGYVLEEIYNGKLENLINEMLVKDFKSSPISFSIKDVQSVQGYTAQGLKVPLWDFDIMAGAGAIRTNLSQMVDYMVTQVSNAHPYIQRSHTLFESNQGVEMGYGWIFQSINNEPYYWHNGGTGGFSSFMAFNIEAKKGIIVLCNSSELADQIASICLDILSK